MKNPYFDLEAEWIVLGAILLQNNIFDKICDILKAGYFYNHTNQEIFKIITGIIHKGQVADMYTVYHVATLKEDLKELITKEFLNNLVTMVPNLDSTEMMAYLIRNNFIKRKIFEIINKFKTSLNDTLEANDIINNMEAELFNLSETCYVGSYNNIKSFEDALNLSLENIKYAKKHHGIVGVSTNFKDIDNCLGGLQNTDLIILAGRPGMGKTALATNIAYNVASSDNAVLYFSLEMSALQLASRILAQETNINSEALRKGKFNDYQLNQIAAAVSLLKYKPLFIDDASILTVSELRSKARKFKRKNKLSLIVVDYLQLLRGEQKYVNKVLELTEITRSLKSVAKELNIPILALSQLSRSVESRDDKIPMLSDLRDSGTIEQDADIVAFIYREEYYLQNKAIENSNDNEEPNNKLEKLRSMLEKCKNLATFIIAKNRHGATRNISLRFNATITKFEDLDNIHK